MNSSLQSNLPLARFQSVIEQRLGLQFDAHRQAFLEELLSRRAQARGISCAAYVSGLDDVRTASDELRRLAGELTVAETYFFRHLEQFRAFMDVAVPARVAANRASSRPLRVLSAGCATGEEAYTLAILLHDWSEQTGQRFEVHAMDLNPLVLRRAARGRYSAWALRETSAEVRDRWFTREGNEYVLSSRIRSKVTFVEGNLIDPAAPAWRSGFYDAVFCRNVLMYFPREQIRQVMGRISASLTLDGFFFLGSAETVRGLSEDFALRQTHGAFYYQRALGADAQRTPAPASSLPESPWTSPAESAGDFWVDVIRRSAERVVHLHSGDEPVRARRESASLPVRAPAPPVAAPTPSGIDGVFRLLHAERFDEALALLDDVGTASPEPPLLLLKATLLAHQGSRRAAEALCSQLLAADPFDAGAHHVLALCREAAGDLPGAAVHNRYAIHLDPAFALARLRLGLSARKSGEQAVARRELAQALLLLEGEDRSRLLLFGGGFGREALIALCRNELRACGGHA